MKSLIASIYIFLSVLSCFSQQTIELNNWKFNFGDNLEWAKPEFNDSGWKPIKAGISWKMQGYAYDNGYGWYRIEFNISDFKKDSYSDLIQVVLGNIDDCDQVFLNGKLLGQNGDIIQANSTIQPEDLSKYATHWYVKRKYTISVNDPRLEWIKKNVLAIRVYDSGGNAGLISLPVNITMHDINSYIKFDTHSQPLEVKPKALLNKDIILKNLSSLQEIRGTLYVEITEEDTHRRIATQTWAVDLKQEKKAFPIQFKGNMKQRLKATCTFTDSKDNKKIVCIHEFPYILTPEPGNEPRLTGAKVVGSRPGSPFLFRISATGRRPITFSAENLPLGLKLDENTGIISGSIKLSGEYKVILSALNDQGSASETLKIVVSNQLALTPPMGWSSWNCFRITVDAEKIKNAADIFVNSGLADHGWTYLNIDDGWQLPYYKFMNMKNLLTYIHQHGLKVGIFSSPGPQTDNGFPGSFMNEAENVQLFSLWGVDYLKYDWGTYSQFIKGQDSSIFQKPYKIMRTELDKINRNIVYDINQHSLSKAWEWGESAGGNLWQTNYNTLTSWQRVMESGFNNESYACWQKPGNWNNPGLLLVGYMNPDQNLPPIPLTPSEQYSQISLWALLSAPLMIGCDLSRLDEFTLNLLTNDEVLAIDQDPLGKQAITAIKHPNFRIMVKDLEDCSKAVGLFNLSDTSQKISIPWTTIKLNGKLKVRDVWRQKDLGEFTDKFESIVPPHGVVLVKINKPTTPKNR